MSPWIVIRVVHVVMEAIVAEVAQACEGQITRYQACVDEDVRTHEQRCRGLKNELSECALKGYARESGWVVEG